MPNIILNIKIKAKPEQIYKALTQQKHLKKWWTTSCKAKPVVGSKARFNFKKADFYTIMKIEKLMPSKYAEWKCVDAGIGTSRQWINTKVIWQILGNHENHRFSGCQKSSIFVHKKETRLKMSHKDWKAKTALFKDCTSGWKYYAGKSLKKYLEKGKGMPFN